MDVTVLVWLRPHDIQKALDRLESVQRLYHSIHVESDIVMNQDVAKTR